MNAGQNLPGIVQFSSPALRECDAVRAVPLGDFEQEVKRLCAEELTPHGLTLLYRELADSRCAMNYCVISVLALVMTFVATSQGQQMSRGHIFNGPDRTITWKSWHKMPELEYRFRTGDRYLGHAIWEHYLGFEEFRSSAKAIKLIMIHLANEDGLGDAMICPGLRYAIFKITNGNMTAHKGAWSWIAQEVDDSKVNSLSSPLAFSDDLLPDRREIPYPR